MISIERIQHFLPQWKRTEWIVVLLCFFVAFGFRLAKAMTHDVWLDETTVYVVASTYGFKELFLLNHWDVAHPPLLYVFVRLVNTLTFGKYVPIEWLRLPFVFFSSLAVFPLFSLARKYISHKNALFVPAWYAVHSFFIVWGFTMRPYGLLHFLFPLAWLLSQESFLKNNRRILFVNALYIFMFLWDYASIWFFATIFFFFFLQGWRILLRSVLQFKYFFLAVVLWIPVFLKGLEQAFGLVSYLKIDHFLFTYTFIQISGLEPLLAQFTAVDQIALAKTIFILLIPAMILAFRSKHTQAFLFGTSFTLIFSYMYSVVKQPIFVRSNLMFVATSMLLVLASTLSPKRWGRIFGILFLILFFPLNFSHLEFTSVGLRNSRIAQNIHDDFRVVYVEGALFQSPLRYQLLQEGFSPNLNDLTSVYHPSGKALRIFEKWSTAENLSETLQEPFEGQTYVMFYSTLEESKMLALTSQLNSLCKMPFFLDFSNVIITHKCEVLDK